MDKWKDTEVEKMKVYICFEFILLLPVVFSHSAYNINLSWPGLTPEDHFLISSVLSSITQIPDTFELIEGINFRSR